MANILDHHHPIAPPGPDIRGGADLCASIRENSAPPSPLLVLLQGTTRTMPLEIYLARETDPESAVALSLVLICVAVMVIAVAYFRPTAQNK